MALQVVDQRTTISDANSATGWIGTNTVSPFTAEPLPIEGTACLGMVVSNTTQNAYFTVTSVDFSAGNSPGPSLIYVWIFHRAELDSVANGGIMIQLGDGTNRVGYHVGGNDRAGFRYDGAVVGWQCFVLDTANLPTQLTTFAGVAANLNLAAITQIGVGFKTLVKAVGGVANCFWDVMRRGAVGQGLLIQSGSSVSPGNFEELAAEDQITGSGRAYGIVRKLAAKVYGVQGPLTFGSTGTLQTFFKDTNATVVFEDRRVTSDKYSITITGNLSNNTTFQLGTKVGSGSTAGSSDGCTLIAPASASAKFIASSSNAQFVYLYGNTFSGFTQGFKLSADATNGPNHEFIGNIVRNCDRVDAGQVFIRNSEFTAYTGSNAALLWNDNINLRNCSFTNNSSSVGDSAGIQFPNSGNFDLYNIQFAGNNYDVKSTTTSSITLYVNDNGDTPTYTSSLGGIVNIVNTKSLTITNLVSGTEIHVYKTSDLSELSGIENSDTTFVYNYNADGTPIFITLIKPGYKWVRYDNLTLSANGISIIATQQVDLGYSNPPGP